MSCDSWRAPTFIGCCGVMTPTLCDEPGLLLPIGEERLPPGARAVLYVVALVSIIFSSFHVAKCLLDASLSIAHGCSAATKSTDGTVALLGVVVIACGIAAPEVLLSIIELSSNNFYVEGRPAAVVDTGAFGLLGVSAACAMAVPAHAVRKLAAPLVALTLICCVVLSYGYLALILLVTSPGVVEIWEASAAVMLSLIHISSPRD